MNMITENKKIEDEVAEKEQRYSTFIKYSSEGIWAYDLEPPLPMDLPIEDQFDLLYERAYISEANDTLARMLGFKKGEELLGMRLDDFQPRTNPDNVAYVENVIREKYNLIDFESTAYGSAGEIIIVLSNILGIVRDGKLLRIWGTTRDITDIKAAEEELKLAEQRYRTVADYTYDWEYWERPDGSLEYVSPSCERITGYSPDEFVNKPELLQEIILPEFRDEWLNCQQDMLFDKTPHQMEFKIKAKDGSIVWVEHAGQQIIDESGNYDGYRASNRDITERKSINNALLKSESRLKEAQQIANIGNWDWDITNNKLYWSDQIFRIFGVEPNDFEATYEAFLDSVHPDDRETVITAVDSALYDKEPYSIAHRIILPDGKEYIVHEQAQVLYDEQDKPVRMFGTIQDITESQRVLDALQSSEKNLLSSQKELRNLAGKLLSAQENERRLLARELHDDLTQRLAVLAINAGKLKMDSACTSDAAKDLDVIQESLIRISEDVHGISRQLHPSIIEDLGLEDALNSEISLFLSREDIPVQLIVADLPQNMDMDISICIFRVVQEALRNIGKYSEAGKVTVDFKGRDNTLYLRIEDDGKGFDPDEVRKKPGIGLSSMRERMRLVGGSISFQSQPEEGCIVQGEIPLPEKGKGLL